MPPRYDARPVASAVSLVSQAIPLTAGKDEDNADRKPATCRKWSEGVAIVSTQ